MAIPVLIVGHKNPDNDSISAAVGYAYLKNELMKRTLEQDPEAEEYEYIPARLGPLPQESEAILNEYSVAAPELINHVHARIQDVMTTDPIGLSLDSTLLDAGRLLRRHNKRAVIVTDEEGKYKGLVSLRMVANRYVSAMDHCDGDDRAKDLENAANDLAASLSQPVSELIEEDVVFLNKDDLLKDSAPSILMSELREGIVLDDEGHCIGIVTRTDVAKRPKRKIILVDHNERSQAANGIDEAEVIEIIDHHRIGDVSTANPIRFMNMPVGSSATIVALQFMENAVEIPRSIAAVLLSAIMTDTVILKSPTATQIDEEVAEKLAAIVGSPVKDFGMKVLSYRGGDADLPIEKLVTADSKEFVVGDDTILIAQHETVTLDVVMQREDEIRKFLSDLREKNDYAYVLRRGQHVHRRRPSRACRPRVRHRLVQERVGARHPFAQEAGRCSAARALSPKRTILAKEKASSSAGLFCSTEFGRNGARARSQLRTLDHILELAVLLIAGETRDLVIVVHEHDMRSIGGIFELLWRHLAIVHDDHLIAHIHQVRCCAIQADDSTAWLSCDHIGFKAIAVIAIGDGNELVFHDACGFHEIGVDGDRSDVIELSLSYGCAMDLALQYIEQHAGDTFLSIPIRNRRGNYQ